MMWGTCIKKCDLYRAHIILKAKASSTTEKSIVNRETAIFARQRV